MLNFVITSIRINLLCVSLKEFIKKFNNIDENEHKH